MNNFDFIFNTLDKKKKKELEKYLNELDNASNVQFDCLYSTFSSAIVCKIPVFTLNLLMKAHMGLESSLNLIRLGYYGSANALFRQVYEFILWSKASVSLEYQEFLDLESKYMEKRLNINNDQKSTISKNKGTNRKLNILKYIKENFDIEIPPFYSRLFEKKELINLSNYFYDDLCALTHATSESQQVFTDSDRFYRETKRTLTKLIIFEHMLIQVFDQYYSEFLNLYFMYNKFNSIENMQIDFQIKEYLDMYDRMLYEISEDRPENSTPFQFLIIESEWKKTN
ncbi:MAG: hypothetical protein RR585_12720 [Coprobacillus sp.]